jgi:hypothetical protein
MLEAQHDDQHDGMWSLNKESSELSGYADRELGIQRVLQEQFERATARTLRLTEHAAQQEAYEIAMVTRNQQVCMATPRARTHTASSPCTHGKLTLYTRQAHLVHTASSPCTHG